jgi:tetratricopeptide (TPR) repeat protein/DNA-binding NarL/FixJ family response regulator
MRHACTLMPLLDPGSRDRAGRHSWRYVPLVASPQAAHGPPQQPSASRAPVAGSSRVDFIAVSDSDELLEQLAQSLDGDCVIRHADTVETARELIAAAQPCVVLIDVRTHPRPGDVIEQVQSPTDTSVIVLFAETEQTSTVASSIRNSAAFAVLPVPLEIAKTAAVLGGARDEVLTRRHVIEPALPATPVARQSSGASAPAASSRIFAPLADDHNAESTRRADAPPRETAVKDGRSRWLMAAGFALLVGVAAAAWLATRTPAPDAPQTAGTPAEATVIAAPPDTDATTPTAVAPPTPTPLPLKSGSVDDLLDLARSALNERRYTDPKNESALVYYRSALAQEPDNGEALEGLARIAVVLEERLQSALAAGRFDDAAQTVSQLKLAEADASRLSAAESRIAAAQIGAALESDDVDRAAVLLRQAEASQVLPADQLDRYRADVERRQAAARIDRVGDLVTARIREGKLVEPANGSAAFHLGQLRKLPGAGSRAAAATRELENAVLERARSALLQKQPEEAERWFAKARSMGIKQARSAAMRALRRHRCLHPRSRSSDSRAWSRSACRTAACSSRPTTTPWSSSRPCARRTRATAHTRRARTRYRRACSLRVRARLGRGSSIPRRRTRPRRVSSDSISPTSRRSSAVSRTRAQRRPTRPSRSAATRSSVRAMSHRRTRKMPHARASKARSRCASRSEPKAR